MASHDLLHVILVFVSSNTQLVFGNQVTTPDHQAIA